MEFVSHSTQETQAIAARTAQEIAGREPGIQATIVALEGELGAGKTTFAQGFIHALHITEKVKSPTFLLIKNYKLEIRNSPYSDLYHLDCYRLTSSQDLIPLEIDMVFKDPKNIILIEWPERIADILPAERTTIRLEHISDHDRKITIS